MLVGIQIEFISPISFSLAILAGHYFRPKIQKANFDCLFWKSGNFLVNFLLGLNAPNLRGRKL
jgi:hypothetical protein